MASRVKKSIGENMYNGDKRGTKNPNDIDEIYLDYDLIAHLRNFLVNPD